MAARMLLGARSALRANTRALRARSAPRATAVRAQAAVAEGRPMWYPGAVAPEYLDGSMDGDYGFDPLRLGANATALPYYREAELMNGRYAMLATAGILFTEAAGLPAWYEAGEKAGGNFSFGALAAFQVAFMSVFEYKRIEAWKKTGETGVLFQFPFDPAGMNSPEMKLKELKNGRLAMVSFLGYVSQYAVTGTTPIAGFKAHLADPTHVNIYTSSVGAEVVLAIAALSLAPMAIIARKSFGGDDSSEFRPIPW